MDNFTMKQVTLTELKSMRDWLPLRTVRVNANQRKFASNLVVSYLQSSHPAVTTYSIHDADKLIGYVMLIQADNPAQWIIERLTIAKDYQRQGYGYAVSDQLIDMVYEFENSEMVIARYDTDNEAARELFAKLKFKEQDKLVRNRNIALLEFEFEESDEDEEYDIENDVDSEDKEKTDDMDNSTDNDTSDTSDDSSDSDSDD